MRHTMKDICLKTVKYNKILYFNRKYFTTNDININLADVSLGCGRIKKEAPDIGKLLSLHP